MWWTVAMAMQVAAGPPDSRPATPRASEPTVACDGSGDEVVVCGTRDQETFRLRALPDRYVARQGLPRATTTVTEKLTVAAESEAGQAIGGAPPRAMVRLKLPF